VALVVAVGVGWWLTSGSASGRVLDAVVEAGESSGTLDLVQLVCGPDAEAVVALCPYQPGGAASEQVGVALSRWAHPMDDTVSSLVALSDGGATAAIELPTRTVAVCSGLQSDDVVPVREVGDPDVVVGLGDPGAPR